MAHFFRFWLGPLIAAIAAGGVLGFWGPQLFLGAGKATPVAPLSTPRDVFPPVPAQARAVTPSSTEPSSAVQIALLGTIMPERDEKVSRAVVRVNGATQILDHGARLADGSQVVAIDRRAIEIKNKDGQTRTFTMNRAEPPTASSAARTAAPSSALPTPISVSSACPATAEQKRIGVMMNTAMLVGALQNVSAIENMISPGVAGLTVKNSAGVGTLLGLRDGDVLLTASGNRLTAARDLVQAVLTPLTQGTVVSVEIDRNNGTQLVTYLPPGCTR